MNTQTFRTSAGDIYCTVVTDESQSLITDTWVGSFGKQENFLTVLYYIAGEIKKHKLKKWLANIKDMTSGFDTSKPELNEKIMPMVIKAGLTQEAVILPTQMFSKLSTKDAIAKIKNLDIKMCGSLEEAKTWLNVNDTVLNDVAA